MKDKIYKIVMSLIMLIVIIGIIFIFYGKNIFNNKKSLIVENIENVNKTESVNATNKNDEKTISGNSITLNEGQERNSISLKEGLDLLLSDNESENVYYDVPDIGVHNKRVKDVYFEGEFNYLDSDCLHLRNVKAGDEVFDDVMVPYGSNIDNNLEKLKDGDVVKVVGTIIRGEDSLAGRTDYDIAFGYKKEREKFYVLNDQWSRDEKDKIDITFDYSFDDVLKKYADKEKKYDVYEFIRDYLMINSENGLRASKIFDSVKFNVDAKCVDLINSYSDKLLKYELKVDKSKFYDIKNEDLKTIQFLATGKGLNISTESIIKVYRDDAETATITYDKEKRKGLQNITFICKSNNYGNLNFNVDIVNSKKSNDIINDEESVNKNEEKDVNEENDNKKELVVGKASISLGDVVRFANKNYKVIKVDDNNDNKVLLMLMDTDIQKEFSKNYKSYWGISDLRKYLNTEYLYDEFNFEDRKRIFITENDNGVKIDGISIDNKVYDKIFILSAEEAKASNLFIKDVVVSSSYVRTQTRDLTKQSIIRPNYGTTNKVEINDSGIINVEYAIYPCMWIDTNINFEKDDNAYKLQEKEFDEKIKSDFAKDDTERWNSEELKIVNKKIVLESGEGENAIYKRVTNNRSGKKSKYEFQKIVFGKRPNTKGKTQDMHWDVVDVVDDKAYLITNQIIDVQNIDYRIKDNGDPISFKDTNIYWYLDNDFYDKSFTDAEKEMINILDLSYTDGEKVTIPNIDFINKYKINLKIKEEGLKTTKYAKAKYKFITSEYDSDDIKGFYLYDTCVNEHYNSILESENVKGLNYSKFLYNQYAVDKSGAIRNASKEYDEDVIYINELGIRPVICIDVLKYNNSHNEKIEEIQKDTIESNYNLNDVLKIGGMDWVIVDFQDNFARVIAKEEYDYGNVLKNELFPISWKDSKLRKYLNNEFYNSKFSDKEKQMIKVVENSNYKKDYYISGYVYKLLSKTYDKIFTEGHDEYEKDEFYDRGYTDKYYKEKMRPTMWMDLNMYEANKS